MIFRRRTLSFFASAVIGVALFLIAGGHWAMLQSVAWATMVHDYSRTASLSQAVENTLDGYHPCPLCKKITSARASEEKAPLMVKADKKAEVFIFSAESDPPQPASRSLVYGPESFVSLLERFFAPPVPVPRSRVS